MRSRKSAIKPYGRKKAPTGGWLPFTLYFVCLILLIFSRLENNQIREMRGLFTDLVSPVLQAASQPAIYARRSKEQLVDYLDLFHELDRLKEENQKMKHWQWQAQRFERRLTHMRKLLNAVEEPALKYATGSGRPFLCSSQRHSLYVANPSLSQMSCQVLQVTKSPHH